MSAGIALTDIGTLEVRKSSGEMAKDWFGAVVVTAAIILAYNFLKSERAKKCERAGDPFCF